MHLKPISRELRCKLYGRLQQRQSVLLEELLFLYAGPARLRTCTVRIPSFLLGDLGHLATDVAEEEEKTKGNNESERAERDDTDDDDDDKTLPCLVLS